MVKKIVAAIPFPKVWDYLCLLDSLWVAYDLAARVKQGDADGRINFEVATRMLDKSVTPVARASSTSFRASKPCRSARLLWQG